jgi:hypothetical protein
MIEAPEPRIDEHPDEGEAAGGVDAISARHPKDPVIPEPPISAQVDEDKVPDAIQERDDTQQEGQESDPDDKENTVEPSG